MKEIIKKYSNQDIFMDAKEKIEKILKGTPHIIEEYFHHKKNAHKDIPLMILIHISKLNLMKIK